MHLPSVSSLIEKASATLKRFPLTLLSAATAAFIILTLISNDFNDDMPGFFYWINGIMVCSVGLTLFTALTIFSEVRSHTQSVKYLLQGLGLFLLAGYFYSLPGHEPTRYEMLRFMIYNFSCHLLVAFLPYVGKREPEGFWGFNKSLFLRILTSALYSAVLFVGLAVALLAVDNLFAVDMDERNYARLYVIIVTIFNTWFFLSGVPRELASLQLDLGYPKGLKIFTQYVLLPIITIYMLILYAYMGKIIISGEWPEGWVSWLVLCFSVAGILALLLVWPVRNDEGNTWMRIYANWFYFALFPLVVMLFLSIRIRIQEYGITEGRYYVGLLAFWLAGTAAYFLFSSSKSIKVIPISLFIVGMFSVHGPWSAFSVSKSSQLNRLIGFLDSNKMLVDGKVVPATGEIAREDHLEIIEKVQYLNDFHGYPSMQDLFTADLDSVMEADTGSRYVNHTDRILALMNLKRISRYDSQSDERYFLFNSASDSPVLISGYDQMVKLQFGTNRSKSFEEKTVSVDVDELLLKWHHNAGKLEIASGDTSVTLDIGSHIRKVFLEKNGEYVRDNIPAEQMTLTARLPHHRIKILIRSSNGNHKISDDVFKFTNLELEFFVGREAGAP